MHMRIVRRSVAACLLGGLLAAASCATNEPFRQAQLAWDGQVARPRPSECDAPYAQTDSMIWSEMQNPKTSVDSRKLLSEHVDAIVAPELRDSSPTAHCWLVSYENHQGLPAPNDAARQPGSPAPAYDLLIAEFDDQGERTDYSVGRVDFEKSEVALIEAQLNAILLEDRKDGGGGLNIIVFTHGWHGSAKSTDDYSIWFKSILEQTTYFERTSRRAVCRKSSQTLGTTPQAADRARVEADLKTYACLPTDLQGGAAAANRRTVGIEIAWRGDSENIPGLSWANFWDRKGAAQTVARGAIHDLMARLHNFYLAHSCHGGSTQTPSRESCDTVHLLTVGHSFGALIDWHALNGDLSTGLLGDESSARAFGFGDLTVFLNPAFEGERESTLFIAATHRAAAYPNGEAGAHWPSQAQMPTLVTLQSLGDWATHYAFPAARVLGGVFENTPGAGEYARSIDAAGWVPAYKTHTLTNTQAAGKDGCDETGQHPPWLCPFDEAHEEPATQPLVLKWAGAGDLPAYLPLWTVAVDTSVMRNHDDISNPAIVRFVAQLFRAAYEQQEVLHWKRASGAAGAQEEPGTNAALKPPR